MAILGQRRAKAIRQRACEQLAFGQTPCTLCGDPQRVSGSLELRNPSDEDLLLSEVAIADSDLRNASGMPIREIYLGRAIPAGESAQVPVKLRLDSATPPGEHRQTLILGNTRQELVVRVAEYQQMEITPTQVSLEGAPRARLARTFLVRNRGNVPLTLDQVEGIVLEEREMTCRALQTCLRDCGQAGIQSFLDALVAELSNARVDLLRTRVLDKPLTIPAAESREVTLEFHLPGNLRPGRRYLGQLPILNKSVSLKVTALGTDS